MVLHGYFHKTPIHSLILNTIVCFTNTHYLCEQYLQSISDPSSHNHIRYIYTQYQCRCRTGWICMGIFIRHLHSLKLHTLAFFTNRHYLGQQGPQSISDPSSHTHIRYMYIQYECRCRIGWFCMGIIIRHFYSTYTCINHKSSQFRATISPNRLKIQIPRALHQHSYWAPREQI